MKNKNYYENNNSIQKIKSIKFKEPIIDYDFKKNTYYHKDYIKNIKLDTIHIKDKLDPIKLLKTIPKKSSLRKQSIDSSYRLVYNNDGKCIRISNIDLCDDQDFIL